jgi:hypothetical protein
MVGRAAPLAELRGLYAEAGTGLAVNTGRFCVYRPEQPVRWTVRTDHPTTGS